MLLKIVSSRTQVLLGTFVTIHFLDRAPNREAHLTPDREFYDHLSTIAFTEIRRIGEMMSFHSPTSELSRLNGAPVGHHVPISPELYEVLAYGLELNRRSAGAFNFAIGKQLVGAGILSPPNPTRANLDPVESATPAFQFTEASDLKLADVLSPSNPIELKHVSACRLKDVWLDLGGIAKGFAVDCAVARILRGFPSAQGSVNAGGDLFLFGQMPQRVQVKASTSRRAPAELLVRQAAVATTQIKTEVGFKGYVNPYSGRVVSEGVTLTVIAPTCMAADGLTKVAHFATPEIFKSVARTYHADIQLHP